MNSALKTLITQFKKLPWVWEKTAQRFAFFMVKESTESQKEFASILDTLKENIHYCEKCCNFSDWESCDICLNNKRNHKQICVVQTAFDVLAIEKTSSFSWVYHVLHWVLSPINNIKPENLKIKELLKRINNDEIEEIIFALSSTMEWDVTTNYIKQQIPNTIKTTHIARGVPSGSMLEYTDEITLSHALNKRTSI